MGHFSSCLTNRGVCGFKVRLMFIQFGQNPNSTANGNNGAFLDCFIIKSRVTNISLCFRSVIAKRAIMPLLDHEVVLAREQCQEVQIIVSNKFGFNKCRFVECLDAIGLNFFCPDSKGLRPVP